MRTGIWSALHFLVDMVCAWAMYAFFCEGNYESFLIYNFCAFALQLPLGVLLDLYRQKHPELPTLCAAVGVAITVTGAFLHPAILGTGNALFHTGAGVDVIAEDFSLNRQGKYLGIFVAPGAIGLYAGMLLGKKLDHPLIGLTAGICMLLLLFFRFRLRPAYEDPARTEPERRGNLFLIGLCCFAVVIIRSLVGLSVSFPWKSVPLLGTLAVFGAAAGKCCGGFLAARFGLCRTATITLLLASVCYLLSEAAIFGLAAIFLFNMTMPLTLYLLADKFPNQPGFAFGLLTFGLFLGFLPVYWQTDLVLAPQTLGAVGSAISCVLLIAAGKVAEYDKISS